MQINENYAQYIVLTYLKMCDPQAELLTFINHLKDYYIFGYGAQMSKFMEHLFHKMQNMKWKKV